MDEATRDLDRRVRDLIRAVQPELRHHLSVDALDRDLVSELYLRLRAALANDRLSAVQPLAERLALIVFLVLVARPGGTEIPPSLMASLRRTFARETGESEAPAERSGPGGSR